MQSAVILAVLMSGSACLLAQSAPIKMGLWEKTMVSSKDSGPPETMTARSCITAAGWQQMVANIQQPHAGCRPDVVKTANGYTFNESCNIMGASLTIHGSENVENSEHIVAESHSTTTMNGKVLHTDTHSTSRFISSSCGSVKPDDPEIR